MLWLDKPAWNWQRHNSDTCREWFSGGGESGDVTINVNFAGSGASDTAARSDHEHDVTYVNEGQPDSVTSAMIVDGAVSANDLPDGAISQRLEQTDWLTGQVVYRLYGLTKEEIDIVTSSG